METLAGSQGTAKRNGNRIRFTLRALIGETKITAEEAMSIPTVAGCVGKIADTVASLEIKLYRRNGDAIEEVTDDKRTKLLNGDTGDTTGCVPDETSHGKRYVPEQRRLCVCS